MIKPVSVYKFQGTTRCDFEQSSRRLKTTQTSPLPTQPTHTQHAAAHTTQHIAHTRACAQDTLRGDILWKRQGALCDSFHACGVLTSVDSHRVHTGTHTHKHTRRARAHTHAPVRAPPSTRTHDRNMTIAALRLQRRSRRRRERLHMVLQTELCGFARQQHHHCWTYTRTTIRHATVALAPIPPLVTVVLAKDHRPLNPL